MRATVTENDFFSIQKVNQKRATTSAVKPSLVFMHSLLSSVHKGSASKHAESSFQIIGNDSICFVLIQTNNIGEPKQTFSLTFATKLFDLDVSSSASISVQNIVSSL